MEKAAALPGPDLTTPFSLPTDSLCSVRYKVATPSALVPSSNNNACPRERETWEGVIAARNSAENARAAAAADPSNAAAMNQLSGAEGGLGGALGRLFAVAEAYPDLKANQTMMQLSEELTTTENRVSFSRQAYNDSVMAFNNSREVFPANIVAGMFNFTPAVPFEVTNPAEREAVKVQF